MRTMGRILTGTAATAAVLFILLGVPAVLWFLARQLVTSADWSSRPDLMAMLLRPDDGTVLTALLLLVGIVVWLVLALSILAELVAVLGSCPTRRIDLPGFRLGRTVATTLIATIVGAGPAMAGGAGRDGRPCLHDHRGTTTDLRRGAGPPRRTSGHAVADRRDGARRPTAVAGDLRPQRRPAEADGSTLTEASTLAVGWQLRLPTDARDVVLVEPGDTLSALAAAHLGDPGRAPELFEANRGVDQAGGPGLADPDLLRPGWLLTLPPGLDTVDCSRLRPFHRRFHPSSPGRPLPTHRRVRRQRPSRPRRRTKRVRPTRTSSPRSRLPLYQRSCSEASRRPSGYVGDASSASDLPATASLSRPMPVDGSSGWPPRPRST